MANDNRNKKNMPPTGEGKKQSKYGGKENELKKRSEILQAERNRPELNIGSADEEMAAIPTGDDTATNMRREKAGR